MTTHFDYLVLGGGSGGIASARRAAQYGARVAVVESARMGGTCVNVGCVPKKLMWHAGQLAHSLIDAEGYGFAVAGFEHDWAALVDRREAYLRRLNGIYQHNLDKDGVVTVTGRGRMLASGEVVVADQVYSADQVLIATGGKPHWPAISGAELGLSSDGFFALRERPERVVLVGSGYIAVELAGVIRALGSEVHLIIRRDRVLRHFDELLGLTLMQEMQNSGIQLHLHNEVTELAKDTSGKTRVTLREGGELVCDALIWAIGREPNTADMGLAEAGVAMDEAGHVLVDEWQETSRPHIYAVGDVTRAPALTPVAIQAGRRLSDRLFGGKSESRLDAHYVPTVVFSHPPIGTIGLSTAEARERYGDEVREYTGTFKGLYSALLDHKVTSAVKMVVRGPQQEVVGLHSIGPGSDEMMQGFAVAMRMGACKKDFDDTIAIHPSAAEELVTLR